MGRILVVGDGPGGLSAGLFLSKNGHETVVFGQDKTAMHYAELHNYLGIPMIAGSDFQQIARAQAIEQGASLRDEEVIGIRRDGEWFTAATTAGEEAGDYVILAGGKASQRLADGLGAERTEAGVTVDSQYRTTVDRVYVVGRLARPNRSQAIISAGAGATAALDIMAREAGKDVTDWDSPSEED